MKKIVAIMGKAGSGKDTILQSTIARYPEKFHEMISSTTRSPREGEQNGVNYYFMSKDDFIRDICNDIMLEFTTFNGWMYGTSKFNLVEDKINIGVFNPAGVRKLLEFDDIQVDVYYVRSSDKERLLRQLNREQNPDVKEIVRRFAADEKDFKDLSDIPYIEVNNLKRSDIPAIVDIIAGQNC